MLIFFDVQTTSLIFFGRKQDGCKHSKVDKLIQNYTLTFNFVKKRIRARFRNIYIQSKANYNDQKKIKKKLHILEDVASSVQVGDIEQSFVYIFLSTIKLH